MKLLLPKNTAYRINTWRRCFGFIDQSTTKYLASGYANTSAETDASRSCRKGSPRPAAIAPKKTTRGLWVSTLQAPRDFDVCIFV